MKRFVSSWSGGKDSCFAFLQAVDSGMIPVVLLNMMNENGMVSRSHAIPHHILIRQAEELGLPIVTIPATWNEYEEKYIQGLREIVKQRDINAAVFGDIDLQPHREWEEKVCHAAGIEAHLPLWQKDRKRLVLQMLEHNIKAYIVSCNDVMGSDYLGRLIDEELIEELESIGVDACGENGEYHTLVVNCPLFKKEVEVSFGGKRNHNKYWFIEMN